MHITSTKPSLLQAFTERAQAAGAQVTHVAGIQEAVELISTTSTPPAPTRYTATAALLTAYPSLRDAFTERSIDLRLAEEIAANTQTARNAAAALQGGVGLVLAAAAVAETGSFLSAEDTLPARLLGMLSDTLFAVLDADYILPGLDEMGAILSQLQAEGKRYLSLVTGPSRTADIERVLTIGVQGPRVAHILILNTEAGG
jgi:L-lactate dehydrogenase complex protein LldG